MSFSNTVRWSTVLAVVAVSALVSACAAEPKPAPMTPLEAALAAKSSDESRADDPAFNPVREDQFTVSDRALEPTAQRSAAPGTSVRADGAAKTAKQKIHPAAP